MMFQPVVESLGPVFINQFAEQANWAIDNALSTGNSTGDSRHAGFGLISGNAAAIAVLDGILNQLNISKYSSILRETKQESRDKQRKYLFLVSTVIPELARYFYEQLPKLVGVNGISKADVDAAATVFQENYYRSRGGMKNPLFKAGLNFTRALLSAGEEGTATRQNTSVADDATANQTFIDKIGEIQPRTDAGWAFVNDILSVTNVDANELNKEVAVYLLLAYYIRYDDAMAKKNIAEYSDFLNKNLEKTSGSRAKGVTKIDDVDDAERSDGSTLSRFVPKDVTSSEDKTNQHTLITDKTQFTARSFVKLFSANFTDIYNQQPIALSGSKDERVTRRDVMTGMTLLFRNTFPKFSSELTPEKVDGITKDIIAADSETALSVHDAMAGYIEGENGSLFDDLEKYYENPSYRKRILEVIEKYVLIGNRRLGQYGYLPEPAHGFGDQSSTDRNKTTGVTTIGDELTALFVNDGESVHILNMNPHSKNSGDLSAEEVETIPLSDIREKCKDYQSRTLVNVTVGKGNRVWGVIFGIQPFSELVGDDFADSMSESPLIRELKTRIGNEHPINSFEDEAKSLARIKSRLYLPNNRYKMKHVGFANDASTDQDYEAFAKKVFNTTTTIPNAGELLTRTASIAKAFTNAANNYLRSCTYIKDDNLMKSKRDALYSAAPTAEALVIQGSSAIDFSVYRFLANEKNNANGTGANAEVSEAIKSLVLAIKFATYVQSTNGDLNNEKNVRMVTKCVDYFSAFANWASGVEGVTLTPEDKVIAAASDGSKVDSVKYITDPKTIARWSGMVKSLTDAQLNEKTGDPIVDQEIENSKQLIADWNNVVDTEIKGKGYTVKDLHTVQKLCKSLSTGEQTYSKFNDLYTATQLLISLRTIGGIGTTEEQSMELSDDFKYQNIELGDLTPADPVTAVDKENANAYELNKIDELLDGNTAGEIYAGKAAVKEVAADPNEAFDEMVKQAKASDNPYDRAMSIIKDIQLMTDTKNTLSEQIGVFSDQLPDDAELNETQQTAVWDMERRVESIDKALGSLKEMLANDYNKAVGVKTMVSAIQSGAVKPNEVELARRIIDVAETNKDSRYNTLTRSEYAYTNDDMSTISHLVSVLGEELFSSTGADVKEAYDEISTLRSYVSNASGNPASMKAINYTLKALEQMGNADEGQTYAALIKLVNKVGRLISSDPESITDELNNTTGLHYGKTNSYANKDAQDNPVDAFARARLRPLSSKNTGVISDKETEERHAFSDNMRQAMKDNPVLAKYAYSLGKAMETFEHSIIDEDERYSDNERSKRMFNSIKSSLKESNMSYGDIAKSTPQRIVYNAIFDDERSGDTQYTSTENAVEHLAGGYNLQLLAKEFLNPGERETGAAWATKRDKATFSYSFGEDRLNPIGSGRNKPGEALYDDDDKAEIIASWFNPDNPISFNMKVSESTGEISIPVSERIKLVKSARQYICSKIADRIGTIDELTGEVSLNNDKVSDALKAAVKSIHALADDMETPIADVIVATTSLGQKNARAALVERAKESLVNNDENYSIEEMGDIANEVNVFPERLSKDLSKVDQDWVDKMTTMVSNIPDDLSVKDVIAATNMYCGSKADQQRMMANPSFKSMYMILRGIQSMKGRNGAPLGYFGDTSYEEAQNLQALINNVCQYKTDENTWKDAADKMNSQLMAALERGETTRRVGNDLPSMSARKRLAHLRMDPHYSVNHSDALSTTVIQMNKALTRSKYLIPGNSSRSVRFSDYDLALDVRTLTYWLYAAANQMAADGITYANSDDGEFAEQAEQYMDKLVMTYVTGVKPKNLKYLETSAEDSKVPETVALGDDMLKLTHAEDISDNMVKVDGIGLLTKDAYVAAVRNAYDTAVAETKGNPSDQDIEHEFYVQMGVLTGKTFNTKTNAYDAETPIYDLAKIPRVNAPKKKAEPPVVLKPNANPVPTEKAAEQEKPVTTEEPQSEEKEEEEETPATVYGAGQ